ncbi:MAG: rhomboid family intramembrane serine protease [Defluviitaleaceae bacterium]|nr:rhomboid family intramembrane serine protease [Defluviitaleaceae bacterium]
MEKKVKVREVKLNIESEFVLNLVSYLTEEESYVFVGNEDEIWLENLMHPKVQLIYINASQRMTAVHANYLVRKGEIISRQIKRKFLMPKVKTLILNTCEFDLNIQRDEENHVSMIHVDHAEAAYVNETLISLFPGMGQFDLNGSMEEMVLRLRRQTKSHATNEMRKAKFKVVPLVTYAYVALLLLFFAYLWFRQQHLPAAFVAIHYGSTYNPLILSGEYWRLLVSAFMHLDLMHLLFNATFIYRFGTMIENIFGRWRMLVIILVSAISGGLFGFALSTNFSLGASGVAYGFMGASVFLAFEMRKTFMPLLKQVILPMLIISTLFSMFMPNIDHFGHLGGFIGGFLAASMVGVPGIKPFVGRIALTVMTMVILISGLWLNGVRLTENHDFDAFNRALIFQYIELGHMERALHLAEIFFEEVE